MMDLVYPVDVAPVIGEPVSPARRRSGGRNLEELPVVDNTGLVIARATRKHCHTSPDKPLHPVVHMHIIDHFSNVLLQKRAADKDLFPGLWDTAVGGHVTYGESLEEALFREAAEELSFKDFNPRHLLTYIWESETQRELVSVYAAITSSLPTPDNEEVQEAKFWTDAEIMAAIGTGVLTPDFEDEYKMIKDSLFALL